MHTDDDLPNDLVDMREGCRLLHCSMASIHRWRLAGRFRAWKRGGRWFAGRAELLGLFRGQAPPAAPPPPRIPAAVLREAKRWGLTVGGG